MPVITIPKPLRDKLGDEATDAFVEVIREIDLETKKELVTKEYFERRLSELEGKMKLYFLILLFVIILVSPKAVDLIAKFLGVIK